MSEAEKFYLKSIEINRKENQNQSLINAWANLGSLYYKKQNYEQAERYLVNAVELQKKIGQEKHPNLAHLYFNLSSIKFAKKQYDGSLELMEKGMHIIESRIADSKWKPTSGATSERVHFQGELQYIVDSISQPYSRASTVRRNLLPLRHFN